MPQHINMMVIGRADDDGVDVGRSEQFRVILVHRNAAQIHSELAQACQACLS